MPKFMVTQFIVKSQQLANGSWQFDIRDLLILVEKFVFCQLLFAQCFLPTAFYQLPTFYCQLSFIEFVITIPVPVPPAPQYPDS